MTGLRSLVPTFEACIWTCGDFSRPLIFPVLDRLAWLEDRDWSVLAVGSEPFGVAECSSFGFLSVPLRSVVILFSGSFVFLFLVHLVPF